MNQRVKNKVQLLLSLSEVGLLLTFGEYYVLLRSKFEEYNAAFFTIYTY